MIYLLEFDKAIGNPSVRHGTARYYLGYCEDHRLGKRLREHAAGRGAALTRAAVNAGIGWRVVLTIAGGDRAMERRLKSWKNHRRVLERFGRFHYMMPLAFVK